MAETDRTYMVRCLAGLEQIVACWLREELSCSVLHTAHRTVCVRTAIAPVRLATLRYIDDVFVLAGAFSGIDHTRAALPRIAQQGQQSSIARALESCSTFRHIAPEKGFSVTASFVGKRNYTRWDIAEVVRAGMVNRYGIPYLNAQDASLPEHDIHVRVHLNDDGGWIGVRLGARPVGKRNYKVQHVKGSLPPQLACCMALLASPVQNSTLLDPMCGAGTVPLEAAALGRGLCCPGIDVSPAALEASRTNSLGMTGPVFMQASAFHLPFAGQSIQSIVCDLPWGRQTRIVNESRSADSADSYQSLLKEFRRVLASAGRMVLLTEKAAELQTALQGAGLTVLKQLPLSLSGKHPVLFVAE